HDEEIDDPSKPTTHDNISTGKEEGSTQKGFYKRFQKYATAWKRVNARVRNVIADVIEFPSRYKKHVQYAFNFTLLSMLVSFPAFSPNMRQWYINIRGAWCGFVAAISLESSI